ncbi:MAG: hypothetical protein KAU17_05265 [Spirochaetales bacterium]|nr:hypothetical protein [Spirochaetales bacterium]
MGEQQSDHKIFDFVVGGDQPGSKMYLLLLVRNAPGTYPGKEKQKKQAEEIEIGSRFFSSAAGGI